MRVRVELTYEMAKTAGVSTYDIEDARTVEQLVERTGSRVGQEFAEQLKLASVAVNGVLVTYRRGMRTRLHDGDIVSFVKAAAGG